MFDNFGFKKVLWTLIYRIKFATFLSQNPLSLSLWDVYVYAYVFPGVCALAHTHVYLCVYVCGVRAYICG